MMTIHRMMLKTHLLLTTHVRSVHFDGQPADLTSVGGGVRDRDDQGGGRVQTPFYSTMTSKPTVLTRMKLDGFAVRVRLRDADRLNGSELHSFKELMNDQAEAIHGQWYVETFEELEAQGHLHPASTVLTGFDACGRLSADGRLYLELADSD